MPKGQFLQQTPNNHPYIRVKDMQHRFVFLDDTYEYVPDSIYPSISRYTVKAHDIILSIVGTVGLVAIVHSSLDLANLTENCVKIVNIKNYLPEYIYYFLYSNAGQTQIQKGIVGSTQPKLPLYNIERIKLPEHSIDSQQHIVDILGSIDEKIENNEQEIRKINDLALCFIAKSNNLNTELKPYIKFIKGKKPIENGSTTAPYLSIDAITSFRYESVYSDDMIMATPFDILMVMDGASSGTVFSHQAGVVSSTIAKIDCSDNIKDYLYWYLLSLKEIIKSRNTGSAIPHANKEYISSLKFDYGFATDIKTINILHSLRTRIIQLQEENKKLQELKGLYLKKFFE